ncbi:HAMP domain-containing sensor histidine kinase [uncultured Tateyamaria sp.]|uniref:ATP-binding response regulator n=1 Tax=uncultured Tateyamaria sp. TaxID=455651 RepID=UPI00262806E5|nr:HAMP domain-containing sensor histidine kinase [uncultured Tateyamaria sp.]
MRNALPEDDFLLLHVDDDAADLLEFSEFLESTGSSKYQLISEARPTLALARLAEKNNISLCIVDLELDDQDASDFNDTVWDGFAFVTLGKILSPSTNFIVLSHRVGPFTKKRAAEVGCFGILQKRKLTDTAAVQVIEQLEYACLYSKNFLRFQSEARLNFSNAIAHTLRRELRKWRNDLKMIKEESGAPFSVVQVGTIDKAIRENDYLEAKLERVLQFYTRDQITPEDVVISNFLEEFLGRINTVQNLRPSIDVELEIGSFDRQLLSIALENLLENANKAISHLGEQGWVEFNATLGVFRSGVEYLKVEVLDNGVGLSPGEEKMALKPNYSGENLADRGVSFGIGCAEAAKIARLHWNRDMSGSLRLDRGPEGIGCRATFIVPLRADRELAPLVS